MGKLTDFLIGLTCVCAVLIVLVFIALIINGKRMKDNARKLLASSDRSGDFIYRLLRTSFPASKILRQAILPLNNGQRAMADLILVDSGGVFVIRVRSFPGKIDNSSRTAWTVENEKGVGEFPNPFEQNRFALTAIDEILKREHLTNVPRHNIVVFSQKRVAFKIRSEKLTTADKLLDTLSDLNRNRFLTGKEINATLNALRNNSTHR